MIIDTSPLPATPETDIDVRKMMLVTGSQDGTGKWYIGARYTGPIDEALDRACEAHQRRDLLVLDPAWEWFKNTTLTPQGDARSPLFVFPLFLVAGARRVIIRDPAIIIPLDSMVDAEVHAIASALKDAEKLRQKIRASISGLELASKS